MDSCIPPVDTVPERRTKSWKREHEETCTRRYHGLSHKAGLSTERQSSVTDVLLELNVAKLQSCTNSTIQTDVNTSHNHNQSIITVFNKFTLFENQLAPDGNTVPVGYEENVKSNVYYNNSVLCNLGIGSVCANRSEMSRLHRMEDDRDLSMLIGKEFVNDSPERNSVINDYSESESNNLEERNGASLKLEGASEFSIRKSHEFDPIYSDKAIIIAKPKSRGRKEDVPMSAVTEFGIEDTRSGRECFITPLRAIEEIAISSRYGNVPDYLLALNQVASLSNSGIITANQLGWNNFQGTVDDLEISQYMNAALNKLNYSNQLSGSNYDIYTVPSEKQNVCVEVNSDDQICESSDGKKDYFPLEQLYQSIQNDENIKDCLLAMDQSTAEIKTVNKVEEDGEDIASDSVALYKNYQVDEERSDILQFNREADPEGNLGMSDCSFIVPENDGFQIPEKKLSCCMGTKDNSVTCPVVNDEDVVKDSIENSLNSCIVTGGFSIGYNSSLSLNNDIVGYTVGPMGDIQVITVPPKRRYLPDPDQQERFFILSLVIDAEQRMTIKDELRSINCNIASRRPDDRHFPKLDSSLKKNTAFVRKLKTFTGNQLDSLLKEFSCLNLTKYVSEVAAALVEAKLKMVDVWPAVQLCNVLHGTYSEFSTYLLDNWHKVLTIKKDEKISNPAKLRVDIRFYAELISVGIFTHKEGLPLLGNVLTMLTHSDREDHHNINIILSFCRHCGDDYAGLIPRKHRELSEKFCIPIPRYKLLPKEKQRNVKALLKDYFNSLCKHLLKEHLELQSFIRQNRKILQTKGELSSERKERLEALQASFDRISNGTQQFSEALDEDFPNLPEDESLKNETLILNGSSESEEGTSTASLWEDEETRRFYECLPDMKEFMPSLQVRAADPEPQISEETLDAEFEGDLTGDSPHDEDIVPTELDEIEESEPVGGASNKILLEAFLTALPNCINREMIDSAAVDFVMTLNTKHNRRKLVKSLFSVPRIRLDLLPFYARLVATLHPVMPDIAADLAQMLKQDFKYHVRKKDQMNIESKIKIVRFIGELVKFRMYSKIEGLYCLKVLVQDFTHHHIEMCCNLLESCGRFFFRHPDCYQRMKVYLEQMMRKKAVMALDSRYVTMIENAYYYVNPPESTRCYVKERPEQHQFIRKILYQNLMKSNTDKVLRLMRKLDWGNPETNAYAVKCLTYAFKVKYFNIRCLASLLAGLATQQEFVGTQVVDGVLEDIRLGMEMNLPKYNQRRVAMIKYLGELYNYRMVESSNIFQVLYSMITFGVTWDHTIPSPIDPPDNLFRIRLVCVLLETCGQYFISGISKKKLDAYLVFFQHYYWFKFSDPVWSTEVPFPVGMNYMFKDTVTSLRPNIHLFTSFEEATESVRKLRMEETNILFPASESCTLCPEERNNVDGSVKAESYHEEKELRLPYPDIPEEPSMLSPELSDTPEVGVAVCPKEKKRMSTLERNRDEDDEDVEDDDEDEEEEVETGEDGDDLDDDEEEDYTEPLSEMDEGDMEWANNSDAASHISEGDSQSEDLNLTIDKDVILPHGPTLVECPEDEDFLTAFERTVSDNIQDRMRESVKPQQLDISVPLHIKGSAKKTYEQLREEETTKSIVNFVLMLRKGHKQQYKNLAVPVDSEMALNLKNREQVERAEKERVKRLTLDINERLEEEDYQEMLAQAQRPVVMNLNRERRHKYQHPKGAPDADLIFGPKKVR